jgi:hypothetical protein
VARRNGAGPARHEHADEARRNAVERRRRSFSRFQNPTPAHYAVYDGQTRTGSIDVIDGAFVTYDASGLLIGHFSTLKKAVDSLGDGGVP